MAYLGRRDENHQAKDQNSDYEQLASDARRHLDPVFIADPDQEVEVDGYGQLNVYPCLEFLAGLRTNNEKPLYPEIS